MIKVVAMAACASTALAAASGWVRILYYALREEFVMCPNTHNTSEDICNCDLRGNILSGRQFILAVAILCFPFPTFAETSFRDALDTCAYGALERTAAVEKLTSGGWSTPSTNDIDRVASIIADGELIRKYASRTSVPATREREAAISQAIKSLKSVEPEQANFLTYGSERKSVLILWSQASGELSCFFYSHASQASHDLAIELAQIGGKSDGTLASSSWKMFNTPQLGFSMVQLEINHVNPQAFEGTFNVLPSIDQSMMILRLQ
ncbi:MAG: hypothetical protein ABJN34_16125 [Litoreibacter sp.]|uniref:hypothetical protein n=1 Tax=Litoreibacter sp. TaxID=1969459 RepID=UPI00329971CE